MRRVLTTTCWPKVWGTVLVVGLLFAGVGRTADAQVPDSVATDTISDESFAPPPPAPPDTVQRQDVGPSEQEKALVSADSLSALVREGERLQELFDNVSVKQDTTRLRSNFALRYLERDQLLFTGDVVIYERGDTLQADTVRYNKQTKVGYARGNVRLTDGEVVVRSRRATYYTEEKRSVFPDSVTLVDSNRVLRAQSGTYWSDERRADFQGRVRLTDPETYLESDSLTYFRDEDRSIAKGRVFIRREETEEDTTGRQRPDSLGGDSTRTAARDTTDRTYLFGDWIDNQEQRRYSRVEGNALLVRVRMDSTGAPADTFAVRAQELEVTRTDTHRRLVAVDSVRIWQADLAAVADSAVYDRILAAGPRDTAQAPAPPPDSEETTPEPTYDSVLDSLIAETDPPALAQPEIRSDTTEAVSSPAPGDTAVASRQSTQDQKQDTLQQSSRRRPPASAPQAEGRRGARPSGTQAGRRVWDRPEARSDAKLPIEETRLFQSPVTWFQSAQVWGDSIRVRAHERSLDTVFVRGAAFAAQQDTTVDRIQQLKGKDITAFFRSDSLRRIRAEPNAQAIRFLTTSDGSLKGAAKASGDRIVLRFRNNSVKRISVIGGVQSNYYRKPEDIPDPFRLEGFQWTPDRKPTREGLLRAPRVRERLAPEDTSRPPLARQRGSQASPSGEPVGSSARPVSQVGLEDRRRREAVRPDSVSARPDSLRARPRRATERPATDSTELSSDPDSQ